MFFALLTAHAQSHWSTWSALPNADAKNRKDSGVVYRTRYDMPAVGGPSQSVCFLQIRDGLRRARMSNVSVRILYLISDGNGASAGKLVEPTVTLTNATDSVVLRQSSCVSVGNVELIGVDRH